MSTHSEDFYLRKLFEETKISEVMSEPVTITDTDSLSAAHTKFTNHGISHLLIVNKNGQLAGLISPKYLYKTQSPRRIIGEQMPSKDTLLDGNTYYDKSSLDSTSLDSVMYKTPFTLGPDDSVAEALISMSKKKIGCIPILDADRKVLGVLTNQEIVNFAANILSE